MHSGLQNRGVEDRPKEATTPWSSSRTASVYGIYAPFAFSCGSHLWLRRQPRCVLPYDIHAYANSHLGCAWVVPPRPRLGGYGNGAGQFSLETIRTGLCNHMSRVADLDGDGDLDIVMKPYTQGAPRVDVLLHGRTNSNIRRR
jgi:hypothetical protein